LWEGISQPRGSATFRGSRQPHPPPAAGHWTVPPGPCPAPTPPALPGPTAPSPRATPTAPLPWCPNQIPSRAHISILREGCGRTRSARAVVSGRFSTQPSPPSQTLPTCWFFSPLSQHSSPVAKVESDPGGGGSGGPSAMRPLPPGPLLSPGAPRPRTRSPSGSWLSACGMASIAGTPPTGAVGRRPFRHLCILCFPKHARSAPPHHDTRRRCGWDGELS